MGSMKVNICFLLHLSCLILRPYNTDNLPSNEPHQRLALGEETRAPEKNETNPRRYERKNRPHPPACRVSVHLQGVGHRQDLRQEAALDAAEKFSRVSSRGPFHLRGYSGLAYRKRARFRRFGDKKTDETNKRRTRLSSVQCNVVGLELRGKVSLLHALVYHRSTLLDHRLRPSGTPATPIVRSAASPLLPPGTRVRCTHTAPVRRKPLTSATVIDPGL